MANKYRGVTWNNSGAGPKVRIRRSIWLAELADFGVITDTPDDLPTRGALHRGSLGATSGTRSYVNLSTVNDLAVVDTQDHGLISDTAISAAIWKTNPENTNVVIAPTYSISPASTSVDEGSALTVDVTTSNVSDGTTLYWTVTYASDFTVSSGSFTVSSNAGSFTVTPTADSSTEGAESFTISVLTGSTTGTVVATSSSITINDTSVASDASAYNWSVTTTIDHPTNSSNTIDTNNYDDSNYQAQLEEGNSMTWTATTNAPNGITVYFTCVSTYYGSYQSSGDPNWNDISGQPGTSGTLTVSNGQVSGTITAIDDGDTEDGELRQIWLMKQAGDYSNVLAKSQWFHLADPSGTWSPPSSGETFLGGEYHFTSGSPQAQWYNSNDSATGNPRVRIRMNEGVDEDLRRNISYVLDNLSVGDSFEIGNNTTTIASMLVSGNISKVNISGNYYDYFFDVNVGPATTTYFYEYIVEA